MLNRSVLSGRVTLSKRAEGELGTRSAGGYYGERSLQSTSPAIASATAATACELLRMERTALDRVLGLAALKLWSNTLAGAKTARSSSYPQVDLRTSCVSCPHRGRQRAALDGLLALCCTVARYTWI